MAKTVTEKMKTAAKMSGGIVNKHSVKDISKFPGPPHIRAWGGRFLRSLVLTELCSGLLSGSEAFTKAGVAVEPGDIIDKEVNFFPYYVHKMGYEKAASNHVHLGTEDGDILKKKIEDFRGCDVLMAGPPCPPWAGPGSKDGEFNPQADVFWKVVEIIKWLGCHGLKVFAIETVVGVTHMLGGRTPFIRKVLAVLREGLPHFTISYDKISVSDVSTLPHNRTRVWIRGALSVFLTSFPETLPGILRNDDPQEDLMNFLNLSLPNADMRELTRPQKKNLGDQERYIKRLKRNMGWPSVGRVACFDISRKQGGVYSALGRYDGACIPLTCKNYKIFITSTFDIHLPRSQRAVCRFMHPCERFVQQGHSPDGAQCFLKNGAVKAAGNAYAVNQCHAVLEPFFDDLEKSQLITPIADFSKQHEYVPSIQTPQKRRRLLRRPAAQKP